MLVPHLLIALWRNLCELHYISYIAAVLVFKSRNLLLQKKSHRLKTIRANHSSFSVIHQISGKSLYPERAVVFEKLAHPDSREDGLTGGVSHKVHVFGFNGQLESGGSAEIWQFLNDQS